MIGRLELSRGQIAQRGMDALVLVHVVQEAPNLRVGIGAILVLGECHLLLFDRPHEPLGIPLLAWLALLSPADVRAEVLQPDDVGRRGVLHPLGRSDG